jgi:hypothetical protein
MELRDDLLVFYEFLDLELDVRQELRRLLRREEVLVLNVEGRVLTRLLDCFQTG